MKDYYQILGVVESADEATIKSAYRKLAREFHPDTNKQSNAEAKFKEIGEAYDTLKDANKRAQYDAMRRQSYSRNDQYRNDQYRWANRPFSDDINVDIEEILKDIRRSRGGAYQAPDAKNRDIVVSYSITLEEAFQGKEAEMSYRIDGKVTDIKFKIPVGIQDGIKLRFPGKGDTALMGVLPGDLFIKISIIPHNFFVRMGYNLVTNVEIGYLDALLGTDVEIPTIEGKRIKMRVPAGIMPGQSLRAAGKGMVKPDGVRGDMMVEVSFQPEKLSETERQKLEEIRSNRLTSQK